MGENHSSSDGLDAFADFHVLENSLDTTSGELAHDHERGKHENGEATAAKDVP